ncbi:hypothetical protein PIB30_064009 [Stylosanthes scabra]|uniref:Putative plant transposon protein domain-containing protein n=1 Tax=Stylosanthes scabra TaxID=79078 RepID=A0ABU6YM50_9FABA|nr:hypothetical protein [Stylosanthes scabra]
MSIFDEHCFRKEFNQELFNSHARKRKVIPEVGFNLNEDEYPQIMEQVSLRGWRRLAAPRTNVSELMVQEFYANAAVSEEEVAEQDELPYKRFLRGIKVDFSPSNIRRVMRFKRTTEGAEIDYNTHKAMDQRLDEVLRDLCIPRATWKLSSSQPTVPIQLKRTELHPLAKGWQEFIIHSLVPTGNKSKVTTTRAILIHSIMQGEDVRAEEIIADNIAIIAQELTNKGNLAHPSTIYKLCKDVGVPLREFRRTPRILELSYITAKRMETIRYESQYYEDLQGIEETLSSMQFFQQTFYENMQKSQANNMEEVKQIKEKQEQSYNHNQRFHSQIWQEQEKLAKEIQEVRRSQLTQTLANNKRLEIEKNMQLALERQGRDIVEMRKQLNLWTRNTSAREAYTYWTHQQANPNLSEILITQIPDIKQTNAEKRRPMFYGCLKSDYGASSSSKVNPHEPVPLRTAPPSPGFRPPHPPPN